MRIERIADVKSNQLLKEENFNLISEKLEKFKGKKGSTIPILQCIQETYGYLPQNILQLTSELLGIPLSTLYGVATFYSQFRFTPMGKYVIKVCHGTACHVQNANAITEALEEALDIKNSQTTPDQLFTLESVACLGCCSLAPVMMINDKTYGKLTRQSCVKVIQEIRQAEKNKITQK